MSILSTVAPIAEHQLGLVSRRQLLGSGVSASAINGALRRGRLRAAGRAVYAVPGAPVTARSRLLAGVLAAGPDAVASHHSAAWLWELLPQPDRHHVSVPRHLRIAVPGFFVHESRDLDLVIPGAVDSIPVTDVGRTILDCASDPNLDLEFMIDEARRRHSISDSLLPWIVQAHAKRGRTGVVRLRELMIAHGMPASDFERMVERWLTKSILPTFEMHHRIVVDAFGPVELDVAWPRPKVALELEGGDHRDRVAVHDHDTVRQNHLLLAGWQILRVTYRRWLRDPGGLLDELHRCLAERARFAS